jgi:hypothetical protein
MAKTRGTGLLMVWADIDPEYEAEYHRWYDEEHVERLFSVPGFLSAGRYVALKGGPAYLPPYMAVPGCLGARRFIAADGQPKYLTLYEFEDAGVSESEPWAQARDSNPRSFRIRPFMRHDPGSPGVYRRIYPK